MSRSAVRLIATTREVAVARDLLVHTDPREPLAWLRRGDGMVGFGTAATIDLDAESSVSPADAWRALSADADVDDAVRLPGTGLLAFGTLVFDPRSSATTRLVVPRTVVGHRGGRSWITRIRPSDEAPDDAPPAEQPYGPHWSATLGPGTLDPAGYQDAVRAGLAAIADGEVDKVVLARDLVGTVPADADLRRLVRALATGYPDTWTYAVDGMIGASPETLVTVSGGALTARVLAGTAPRGADHAEDAEAAATLAASDKNRAEHRFAVRSVVETLAPHAADLRADPEPFTLELPNVWHLATDLAGTVADGASALDLVAALHPTAAVAGTPTDAAREAIRRIEPFDRGRYAGPVGWVDAAGDGEWAIALRCAQIGAAPARRGAAYTGTIPVVAYAGAGIVAGSDPESELLETRVKFRPIVDALA